MTNSFVLYRLPNEDKIHFINDPHAKVLSSINEVEDSVFVMTPFDLDSGNKIITYNLSLSETISEIEILELDMVFKHPRTTAISATRDSYIKTLNKMILLIKNQRINKGVLSRIKTIKRDHKNINQVFLQLTKSYPTTFVYLALSPNGEMWCGASPETLATYTDGTFRTVALAGTQLINNRKIAEIKWDTKEKEEQVWVQKHISTIFNEADIAYRKSETYSSPAGHIVHLKNDFWANTTREQATELIQKLQPTPAVCGTPTLAAKRIILDLETHERKYYSGYIGLLGLRNIQLFVNLRCMMIDRENYHLFVGGGITADSHAESEWLETENKAHTLESVLNK